MLILHVLDHSIPLHSGYTFRSRAIFEHQRQRGWQTEHITSTKHADAAPDQPDEEDVDGLHFFRTPRYSTVLHRMPMVNQYAVIRDLERRLKEVVRQVKPDILHAHSPALNGVAAVRVGRAMGIPVAYEVRGFWEDAAVSHGTAREGDLRYRITRGLETWALKHADHCFCICEGLRQDIAARGIAKDKITVIPNAVDIANFQPVETVDEELRTALSLQGKHVVGFIGSYYYYEGLDLLLDAAKIMRASLPNLHVLLVGGGPAEQKLQQQADALGIADMTTFVGRVPQSKVSGYYSLIDVLAYPRQSMRITELVTPLKPLEAMAQKRLFVASDVGGHRELIVDGETGVLHRAGDAADLAAKMIALLQDAQRGAAIKEAGRRFVETERNWSASIANYDAPYHRMLA
ncbi:MAG: glycosyltransferase, exosortase A system-associated [Gammaproteobacteria bacterium]|nr:glycosyltransferase, exosortase A system-associated [Gammaproteobacteria bacterium]